MFTLNVTSKFRSAVVLLHCLIRSSDSCVEVSHLCEGYRSLFFHFLVHNGQILTPEGLQALLG